MPPSYEVITVSLKPNPLAQHYSCTANQDGVWFPNRPYRSQTTDKKGRNDYLKS